MGGVAVGNEMERGELKKRKHNRVSPQGCRRSCVFPSDPGRQHMKAELAGRASGQGAARIQLTQRKQHVLNLWTITSLPYPRVSLSLSLSPSHSLSSLSGRYSRPCSFLKAFALSLALLQRRLWAVQGVWVCLGETVWHAVCVWASRGPTRESLTGRQHTELNKAHAWQLEEPVSAARY